MQNILYTALKLHQDLWGFILIHCFTHTLSNTNINHGQAEMNKQKVHSEQIAASHMQDEF